MKRLRTVCLVFVGLAGCQEKPHDVEAVPKPHQAVAAIALPQRLLSAVAKNFPQYHIPAGGDLTGQWAEGVQAGTPPFMCHGDFNGDGLTDEAIVLIGQDSWRFVIFEQRQGGDFVPVYAARAHLPSELPKSTEDSSIEAPQEMVVEKIAKGQLWAPEGGDEPYEVKLQTDGIILHHRKKLRYADIDETTLLTFKDGRYRQNFAELLAPVEKP